VSSSKQKNEGHGLEKSGATLPLLNLTKKKFLMNEVSSIAIYRCRRFYE